MKLLLASLAAVVVACATAAPSYAQRRAEDGSRVPAGFYQQTDRTPVGRHVVIYGEHDHHRQPPPVVVVPVAVPMPYPVPVSTTPYLDWPAPLTGISTAPAVAGYVAAPTYGSTQCEGAQAPPNVVGTDGRPLTFPTC